MDWYEVLYQWERYSEILYPLRDEVADIFKTKCFYNDNWDYQEKPYVADDDTVFLLKLSSKLKEICEFVASHISVLKQRVRIDEEIRENTEQAFEAWKRGLCTKLMKPVQRYTSPDNWNLWQTYDEIAEFLQSKKISYDATKKAIREYESSLEDFQMSA